MTDVVVLLVALAFVAALVWVALAVRALHRQIDEAKSSLVLHVTRCARLLTAQQARDHEEQGRHLDATAAALLARLAPYVVPAPRRAVPAMLIQTAPSAAYEGAPQPARLAVGSPEQGARTLGEDEPTPPSGWSLDEIREHTAQLDRPSEGKSP